MPLENLTGKPLPADAARRSLLGSMAREGFETLGDDVLERFLEKHRVRHTSGIHRKLASALRQETGVEAVLFVSLELFEEEMFPKVALSARLVSAGDDLSTLWADGVGISGNDHPGFLLLGLVYDVGEIWDNAKRDLIDSLKGALSGKTDSAAGKAAKKLSPRSFYGAPLKISTGRRKISVAVLPFENDSMRRNAGEIMALHFTRELFRSGDIEVVEAGEVRQILLQSRTIMEEGLSLPQADILKAGLDVDLLVTGIVTEYRDSSGPGGVPKVEFTTRIFNTKSRQVVWSSTSYNKGDDGVFFFDHGRNNVAHEMASGMVRSVVAKMHSGGNAKKDIGGTR